MRHYDLGAEFIDRTSSPSKQRRQAFEKATKPPTYSFLMVRVFYVEIVPYVETPLFHIRFSDL